MTKKRHSTAPGIEIIEKELKLQFFYRGAVGKGEDLAPCIQGFSFSSRKAMADFIGLGEATLKPDNLTLPTQQALADRLGFTIDWPEWKTGKATEFARKYNDDNWYKGSLDAGGTAQPPPPDRNTVVELVKGQDRVAGSSKISGLAGIEFTASQAGHGTACIGFDLSGGYWTALLAKGIKLAITRGVIEIDCGWAKLQRDTRKGWGGERLEVAGSAGKIWLTWLSDGSLMRPRWQVEASGDQIGDVEFTPDFATVENIAAGDVIKIYFSALPKDTSAGIGDDVDIEEIGNIDDLLSDAGVNPQETYSMLNSDGKKIEGDILKISDLKEKFIKMVELSALQDEDSNYIPLASHEIEFVAKEPSDEEPKA